MERGELLWAMFRAAAKLRECHRETKQTNPFGTNQHPSETTKRDPIRKQLNPLPEPTNRTLWKSPRQVVDAALSLASKAR